MSSIDLISHRHPSIVSKAPNTAQVYNLVEVNVRLLRGRLFDK